MDPEPGPLDPDMPGRPPDPVAGGSEADTLGKPPFPPAGPPARPRRRRVTPRDRRLLCPLRGWRHAKQEREGPAALPAGAAGPGGPDGARPPSRRPVAVEGDRVGRSQAVDPPRDPAPVGPPVRDRRRTAARGTQCDARAGWTMHIHGTTRRAHRRPARAPAGAELGPLPRRASVEGNLADRADALRRHRAVGATVCPRQTVHRHGARRLERLEGAAAIGALVDRG